MKITYGITVCIIVGTFKTRHARNVLRVQFENSVIP